jgi:predicted metal-dependent hydrolase
VPEELSQPNIENLIERKRSWIYRQLAEWRDLNASTVPREYVNAIPIIARPSGMKSIRFCRTIRSGRSGCEKMGRGWGCEN